MTEATPNDFLLFQNQPSAESAAEFLRGNGVPATVEVCAALPGLVESVRVVVPSSLLHRARWLLNLGDISDSELDFIATGRLEK
jgi:hypothetical protein